MTMKNEDKALVVIFLLFFGMILFAVFYHWYFSKPEDLRVHGCKVDEGYVWCESKEKCLRYEDELCPSQRLVEVKNNLSVLREQSLNWFSVDKVSKIQEGDLDWHFNDGMMALVDIKTAYLFKLSALKNEDLEKIKNYLLDNDYKEPENNALNTAGGGFQINYNKDDHAIVIETNSVDNAISNNNEVLYNATIYCILIE